MVGIPYPDFVFLKYFYHFRNFLSRSGPAVQIARTNLKILRGSFLFYELGPGTGTGNVIDKYRWYATQDIKIA